MAVQIQNMPEKNFNQNSIHPVSNFSVSYPSWWGSNEQKIPESLSKNMSLKLEPPPQHYHNVTHLGLQLPDQDSSSTQSGGHQEVGSVGGINSQDQCISSESGRDESCGKGVEGQMEPILLLGNPDLAFCPSQVTYKHSMAHVPYADPYFGGLLTAYGPQTIIQPQMGPQMAGMAASTRVPLPLDLAEDGPVFVNAKQYRGILRRRQSRAKLEAQNRLVKARKPYLHESRHLHAVNRVRGSGGRFLSTKKLQQPSPSPTNSTHCVSNTGHLHQKKDISEIGSHGSRTDDYVALITTCSDINSVSNSDVIFQQPDRRFSGIFPLMGGTMQSGGCGTHHCASIVR